MGTARPSILQGTEGTVGQGGGTFQASWSATPLDAKCMWLDSVSSHSCCLRLLYPQLRGSPFLHRHHKGLLELHARVGLSRLPSRAQVFGVVVSSLSCRNHLLLVCWSGYAAGDKVAAVLLLVLELRVQPSRLKLKCSDLRQTSLMNRRSAHSSSHMRHGQPGARGSRGRKR